MLTVVRSRAWALVVVLLLAWLLMLGGDGRAQGEPEGPATPNPLGPAVPPEVAARSGNWPMAQGDLAGHRAAVGSTIAAANVAGLDVAWTFPIVAEGDFGGFTANPVVVGDRVYLQDMQSNVFALDRASGQVVWEKQYGVPCAGPNGVAVGYGLVYAPLGDTAEVVALTADTGQEVWRVRLSNSAGEGIDVAPVVYGDVVYVSTVPVTSQAVEFYRGGNRGVLYALDAKSGATLWWFDTTTDNLWGNPRLNSGGGLWYPPSIDAAGNLYFGVGNPAPWPGTAECPNGSCRPGPNDYASSLVSLDPNGSVRWHYNAKPHDLFDHDFQATPILATLQIGGEATEVAIGAGKTGTVAAVAADTGRVLWEAKIGRHQNDDLQQVPPGQTVEVYPGDLGGVETPLAYADGVVFVPYVDFPQYVTSTGPDFSHGMDFATGVGGLVALNASDGTVKWDIALPTINVGAATVANDVVFTSGLDGLVRGYAVDDGRLLWSYQAGSGFNAPPAIAGDMLFVAAAGPLIVPAAGPIEATPAGISAAVSVQSVADQPVPELIAFRLGGAATPVASRR